MGIVSLIADATDVIFISSISIIDDGNEFINKNISKYTDLISKVCMDSAFSATKRISDELADSFSAKILFFPNPAENTMPNKDNPPAFSAKFG